MTNVHNFCHILLQVSKNQSNNTLGRIKFVLHQSLILHELFCNYVYYGVRIWVFNATFNNISGILWRSVLLVEETTYKLYHIGLYRAGFELKILVGKGTACIDSFKSYYHTITTMTAPC